MHGSVHVITHGYLAGELHSALSHLETFYQLARRHKWHTESGEGLHEISCEHLRRVYTLIADQVCVCVCVCVYVCVCLCVCVCVCVCMCVCVCVCEHLTVTVLMTCLVR